MTNALILLLIGFFAQLVDGSVGVGYGTFSASILLAFGLYPVVVSASIHTAEIFTSFLSGGAHLSFGNIDKKLFMELIFPGIIGGILGALFLGYIIDRIGGLIKIFLAVILMIFGLIILINFLSNNKIKQTKKKHSAIGVGFLGFIAAFIDAIGGGGWGPITTSSIMIENHTEPRKVVGTVNLVEFFVTVSIALTFFFYLGSKILISSIIFPLLIGGAIAAPVAAYLCKKLPIRTLGILIGGAIILFNLKTLFEFF